MRDLSKKTEISLRTLENISANKTDNPSLETAKKISLFFKISIDDLASIDLSLSLDKQ